MELSFSEVLLRITPGGFRAHEWGSGCGFPSLIWLSKGVSFHEQNVD